jgi:glycosyltransferase involved in cell wall biosynthesis
MTSPRQPILIYTPYSSSKPGAAGMRVWYLEQALTEKGFSTHTLSAADGKGWKLARKIASLHPHAVIATSPPLTPLFWVWIGCQMARAPFILDAKDDGKAITLLATPAHARSLKDKTFLRLRQFIYTQAQSLWFLTQMDRDEAMRRYHVPAEKTQLVPNGTDARIPFDARARIAWRKKWKCKPSTRVGIYAGSIGDEEIVPLLESLAAATNQKNIFLVLVLSVDAHPNDQRELARIEAFLSHRFPKNNFTIIKNTPITEMRGLLSAADVGFIPWPDAFPTSIPIKAFDYAGTGLPILAKAPRDGELSHFLNENPALGRAFPDWSAFADAFAAMKKFPSPTARKKSASNAQHRWSRAATMQNAVLQTFGSAKEFNVRPGK